MSSNEEAKQASEIVTKNTTIQAKLTGYKQTKQKLLVGVINTNFLFCLNIL